MMPISPFNLYTASITFLFALPIMHRIASHRPHFTYLLPLFHRLHTPLLNLKRSTNTHTQHLNP
ncbi:uncharacterized protein BDW43DRAFT_267862, partial [Aspergillus alliaceus]|uniref:uncharacterized protein n=1 Tax=Petromyces alliaceus TaxID=209559 RepID=UPI0012A74D48